MNINKHNYEAFFLDYHEGNLSPQEVAELLLFVEQNPELKEEFECFENITLDDLSSFTFEGKNALKKEINTLNREEYFIGSVEKILNPAEQNLLTDFLKKNPQYISEFDLYQKTKISFEANVLCPAKEELKEIAVYQNVRLVPDLSIVYENKEELKRKERRVIPFYYYVAAAAAVLLLFGLFNIFSDKPTEKEFADGKTNSKQSTVDNKQKDQNEVVQDNSTNSLVNLSDLSGSVVKNIVPRNKTNKTKEDSLSVSPSINQTPEVNIANNVPEKKEEQAPENKIDDLKIDQPVTNNAVAVQVEEKKENSSEFMTLAQVAASKIKEKTLDPESLEAEKKSGRVKKFNGWDVLRVVAKGVSKVTGKDVEVKPTYNNEGEVTAYAFNAGKLGFSREKGGQ